MRTFTFFRGRGFSDLPSPHGTEQHPSPPLLLFPPLGVMWEKGDNKVTNPLLLLLLLLHPYSPSERQSSSCAEYFVDQQEVGFCLSAKWLCTTYSNTTVQLNFCPAPDKTKLW